MTMNDQSKSERLFTRNFLVPLALVVVGSAWFILSVVSFCVGILFPSTKHKLPPLSPPRHSDRTSDNALPTTVFILGNVVQDDLCASGQPTPPRPNSQKRWSLPAGFTMYSSSAKSGSSTTLVSNPPIRKFSLDLPRTEISHGNFKELLARKTSLVEKIPGMKMFKMRTRKRREDVASSFASSSTTPSNMSPQSSPLGRMKDLETEPDDLNHLCSHKSESPRVTFTSPFKYRPKRSSAGAVMSTAYATFDKPTLLRSSTDVSLSPVSADDASEKSFPSSTSSKSRKKRFSSILALNLNLQASLPSPLKTSSGTTPSATPSRYRTLSATFAPLTPSFLKTPKTATPALRTQPYGAPYFARMPNGQVVIPSPIREKSSCPRTPERRRSSLDRSTRKVSSEEDQSPQTAKATNALGLSLQQAPECPRRKVRHRRMVSDSVIDRS